MTEAKLVVVGVLLFALSACGDDGEGQVQTNATGAGWIDTTYPCETTEQVAEGLKRDPSFGMDFEMQAARRACGPQGKTFSGKAQCVKRTMQVMCE